jgi:hypothetical protein
VADDKPDVPDDVLRFNQFLADEKKAEQEQRSIERAQKAKQRAADEVRRLDADPKATREARAEAEQRYIEAVAEWRRVQGETTADD